VIHFTVTGITNRKLVLLLIRLKDV
jgi:hypothetical protein